MPVDGAPDEHRHLILAYAMNTDQVGGPRTVYSVPKYLATNRSRCYTHNIHVSAACDRMDQDPSAFVMVDTPTTANTYPPLYYRIAGWPLSRISGDAGVYAARLVGVVVSSALLALALTVAWSSGSRWFGLGAMVAITPMTGFMVGSFNPHGLELAGSLAFIVGLLALLHRPGAGGQRLARATVFVALLPMTFSRPNGFIWPVLLTALITLSAPDGWRSWTSQPRRFVRWFVALTAGVILIAMAWQVLRGRYGAGVENPGARITALDGPFPTLMHVVWKLQSFPGDWVGVFGWLDTRVSSVTLLIWFSMVGGLVLFALAVGRRKDLTWAAVSLGCALAITVVLDVFYQSTDGVVVSQARYVLQLVMLALCLVALSLRDAGSVAARLPAIVVTLWIVGSLLAFGEALRRYTLGASLLSDRIWYPPVSALLLVFAVGGGLLMIGLLMGRLSRDTQWRVAAATSVVILGTAVFSSPIASAVGG